LVIAAASFAFPIFTTAIATAIYPSHFRTELIGAVLSFSLTAAWLVLSFAIVLKYRWRGAFTLLSLPLAGFWPWLYTLIWTACKWSPVQRFVVNGVEHFARTGCI